MKLNCNREGIIFILTLSLIYFYIISYFFNTLTVKQLNFIKDNKNFINYNKNIQFLFPYLQKDKNKILYETGFDFWSILHILIYFTAGLIFPNEYGCIILFSILCEMFEYFAGFRARLSDIFINLLSYYIGSSIINKNLDYINFYFCNNKKNLISYCIPTFIIFLYLLYRIPVKI